MSALLAGTATTDITPPLGTYLAGYYHPRQAQDVHDPLQARALCLSDGQRQIAFASVDLIGLSAAQVNAVKQRVHELCGLEPSQILVGCTHTHTGPEVRPTGMFPVDGTYLETLVTRIADAITMAQRRLAPATVAYGTGLEPSLAFNRRYWLRDGTLRTNPGIGNPEVVRAAGPIDPVVGVLSVQRPDGSTLALLVNYALHLDTTGGDHVSADYPSYLAAVLRRQLGPELTVLFHPGAMGDINHINVRAVGAPLKGAIHPERIGKTLAAAVLKALPLLQHRADITVDSALTEITVPLRAVTPERAAQASAAMENISVGRADFTLDAVAARRDRDLGRLSNGLRLPMQALRIGNLGVVAFPGEAFVELGLAAKARSPLANTMVVELANDSTGYIPTRRAYDEGGYEVTSSVLAPGTGELMLEEGLELLRGLAAS